MHGPMKDFLAERSKRNQRVKTLLKKKRVGTQWIPGSDEKETTPSKERKKDHLKTVAPVEEQQPVDDRWSALNRDTRRELYSMVKENKEEELTALISERGAEEQKEIFNYLNTNRFSSDNGTFLHLAARSGADRTLRNRWRSCYSRNLDIFVFLFLLFCVQKTAYHKSTI
ncbi:hypothetical protein COOONC_05410 [Cooperia oncophora]